MNSSVERLLTAAQNMVGAWDMLDAVPSDEELPTEHYRDMIDEAVEELRAAIEAVEKKKEA